MSYLDKHPAGAVPPNRRAKFLEFLTGFAGWFALFSLLWTFAGALGEGSIAQTSTTCLFAPSGVDMLIAVWLILARKWSALAGFLTAFIVNGIGLFVVAVLGYFPGGFNLPALVMHLPFYFPLMLPVP